MDIDQIREQSDSNPPCRSLGEQLLFAINPAPNLNDHSMGGSSESGVAKELNFQFRAIFARNEWLIQELEGIRQKLELDSGNSRRGE